MDLKTNKRDEIERYVALSDDHYELKEQLVFIGDSMSIRTVFITDSTEYHYIYNENQELQTRYYVHLTESEDYFMGSLLYKKSEKSVIYWEEDFDNTGNLRVKKWYDEEGKKCTKLEAYKPTGEALINYNLTKHKITYFDRMGNTLNEKIVTPKKLESQLRNYIKSYTVFRQDVKCTEYNFDDLYVVFYITTNGEIEFLNYFVEGSSRAWYQYLHSSINSEKDSKHIRKGFSKHLQNVGNADIQPEPCTLAGSPVDNIIVLHFANMKIVPVNQRKK